MNFIQKMQQKPLPTKSLNFWKFMGFLWFFLGLLSLGAPSYSKTLTAYVDREEIEAGEMLTLVLKADFQTDSPLNFQRLIDQFEILGQQKNHHLKLMNSTLSSETLWRLILLPKQTGVLMIPPFQLDDVQTQPIKIRVTAASQKSQATGKGSAFFLTTTLESPEKHPPYVQQMVHYRLRLFYQGQLIDGNLRAPSFKGTLHQLVTNQKSYSKILQGQLYQVYEWDYLLFPQHSGTLTIEAATFNGRAQWQGQLRSLRHKSEPLKITVKPKPNSYPATATWLPAQKVKLYLTVDRHQIQAGETVKLTLTLAAQGLLPAQLPKITLPKNSNYKLYLENTQTDHQWQKDHLISQNTFHYLLVPKLSSFKSPSSQNAPQINQITLEPIQLPWWSTEKDQLEIARTQPLAIQILPAIAKKQPAASNSPQVSHGTFNQFPEPFETPKIPSPASQNGHFWLWLGLVSFIALTLLALWMFWQWRQKPQPPLKPQQKTSQGNKKTTSQTNLCQQKDDVAQLQQCQRNDWIKLYQQLQPQKSLMTAEEKQAFYQIKQHLFAKQQSLEKLQAALKCLCPRVQFNQYAQSNKQYKSDKNTHLSILYP